MKRKASLRHYGNEWTARYGFSTTIHKIPTRKNFSNRTAENFRIAGADRGSGFGVLREIFSKVRRRENLCIALTVFEDGWQWLSSSDYLGIHSALR